MRKTLFTALVAATAVGGIAAGLSYGQHVQAADEVGYEPDVASGAPSKVLIENSRARITLASHPAGFKKEGGKRRPFDQIIVWVDEGDYTVIRPPGAPANPNAGAAPVRGPESAIALDGSVVTGKHPAGTVVWHPKDSRTPKTVINKAYRSLYIELKS